jgi:hypothetical protein
MVKRKNPPGINYGRRWRKAREVFLAKNPFCADPFGIHGKSLVPATQVDHKIPHRGNPEIFWDVNNWQPLCAVCHSRKTMMHDAVVPKPQAIVCVSACDHACGARADCVLDTRSLVATISRMDKAIVMPRNNDDRWRSLWEAADAMIEAALPRLRRARISVLVITDDAVAARRLEAGGIEVRWCSDQRKPEGEGAVKIF